MRAPTPALKYVITIGITMLIGYASGMVTRDAIDTWYVTLNKPWFNPPNWIFGPVWSLLYIAMGVAAARVWIKSEGVALRGAMLAYGVQLLLNAFWSIAFFGMRSPELALVVIIALWLAIVWCLQRFKAIDRPAAWLLVPYLLWVSFATLLNVAIVRLN